MIEKMLKRDELMMKLTALMQILESKKMELINIEKLKEDINEDLTNKEILFKINPNILMSNKGYFVVRVGENVFLEKNKDELLAYLEKKEEDLKEKLEELKKEIKDIETKIKLIDEELAKSLPSVPLLPQ
jgi:prefoldin subunit 5